MSWAPVAAVPVSRREADEIERNLSRKAKPRFYADENFPAVAASILRERGADVVTVQEKAFRGHPDENHLAHARKLGRMLITCDRDYLDERKFPLMTSSSLAVFDFGRGSREEMVQAFRALSGVFAAPAFYDKWIKLDASRECWIEAVHFQNGERSKRRCRWHNGQFEEWIEDTE